MADWSQLVKGFQGGSRWADEHRANRQLEQRRSQVLKGGQRELNALEGAEADALALWGEETQGMEPYDYDSAFDLPEPMAYKLGKKIKSLFSRAPKAGKRKALDLGSGSEAGFETSNPVGPGLEEESYAPPAQTFGLPEEEEVAEQPMADGGTVDFAEEMATRAGAGGQFATQANAVPNTTVQAGGARPMPSVTGPIDTGRNYADGGMTEEEKIRERAQRNRERVKGSVERQTESVRGADRTAPRKALDVGPKETAYSSANRRTGEFMQTRPLPNEGKGVARVARGVRNAARGAKGLGALGALGSTALDAFDTPTEQYRERFGLETDDPSLLGDIGVRALGAASDLGNAMTLGAAGNFYRDKQRLAQEEVAGADSPPEEAEQAVPFSTDGEGSAGYSASSRTALPSADEGSDSVDFSSIDIDAKDVPDMKTDEWRKYRAALIRDGARRGQPVDVINDRVTQMQQKQFLNYGQQGFALQQAGNYRAAMAAYRAAFQYFPNGNDVEFGTSRNKRSGATQIVGFGRDEKTGKIVPGSELVMDPERVATMLENFKNPSAFRAWTKDWRDFRESQKRYTEVTKPLAQAQADSLANNSEANMVRAFNAGAGGAGAGGGLKQSDMRAAQEMFGQMLMQNGVTDPAQAMQLGSIAAQLKQRQPQLDETTIMLEVMRRAGVGTGLTPTSAPAPSPRRALPAPPRPQPAAAVDMGDEDVNNPPPGVDTEQWFSPAMQGVPYADRVFYTRQAVQEEG